MIDAEFITGLSDATELALSGVILFVADHHTGTVGEYNAATGETINANFITGLTTPTGLAVMPATPLAPESFLFVANHHSGTVGKYDATTGDVIDAKFITGLDAPVGIAVESPK